MGLGRFRLVDSQIAIFCFYCRSKEHGSYIAALTGAIYDPFVEPYGHSFCVPTITHTDCPSIRKLYHSYISPESKSHTLTRFKGPGREIEEGTTKSMEA